MKERNMQTDILILADEITNVKIALLDLSTYHFITPLLHEVAIASIHSDHIKGLLRMLINEKNKQLDNTRYIKISIPGKNPYVLFLIDVSIFA